VAPLKRGICQILEFILSLQAKSLITTHMSLQIQIRKMETIDVSSILMIKKLAEISNVITGVSQQKIEDILRSDFESDMKYYEQKILTDRGFVIEYLGSVIGCGFMAEESDYNIIQSVYIEPSFQNKGIGTILINYLITESKSSHKKYIELETATAQNFYKKLGFTDVENSFKMRLVFT
jgi:N-acetylglutamate synthase-like GNAT family acetyltransferase